ncbi:MAG: hypothetical protein KKA73_16795 [Chloroflexi bacterium]|nr:hypothetical protein [Chloroflexota bacterium]MBU1749345.1 hypothetical protein [Chloroflexota bacterium]MBU1879032.1 hypothetical protein [Chloroflexota bacterium]
MTEAVRLVRWATRLSSIAVSSVFLLIMALAITNEDAPQTPAIPVLVLLALTIMGCIAAWRWEKIGGGAAIIGAIGLGIAVYAASSAFGLDSYLLLLMSMYSLPFLVIGILFLACGYLTRPS